MTIRKRGLSFWAVLAVLALGGSLSADPITFFAGTIDHFALHAAPQGDGTVRTEIKFDHPMTTYINNGTVTPLPTSISRVFLTSGPIPVASPLGQQWFGMNPGNAGGTQHIQTNNGAANFSIQWGLAAVYTDIPNPDENNVVPTAPFPTTPQGPNGLTVLGNAVLTDNNSGLDFSPFGPALSDGGLIALQLTSDDPNTNVADVLAHGGNVTGTGSFQQTGISSPVNTGEVPEPTTMVLWAVTTAAGVVATHRYGRKVLS